MQDFSYFSEDFQSALIPGRAKKSAMLEYFEHWAQESDPDHQEMRYIDLPFEGWRVSRIGFGSYRVKTGVLSHRAAIQESLLSGSNVIDTSSNYADGLSESLIGSVLAELFFRGKIKREQILVITKGGYIQGRNYRMLKHSLPEETVHMEEGFAHSISPDFLKDQIELSRRRLGIDTIDLYLLHNPEYYLKQARRDGIDGKLAKDEYYRRIQNALEFLEEQRKKGLIVRYGISSNTFVDPDSSYEKTDLQRILTFAPEGFSAIQFPANLVETGFVGTEPFHSPSVCQIAREANLWTISNRPFNSILENQLFRLASIPPSLSKTAEEQMAFIWKDLETTENRILNELDESFRFDSRTPSMTLFLERYLDRVQSSEQLNQILPSIIQSMQQTINHLRILQKKGFCEPFLVNLYTKKINESIKTWEIYSRTKNHAVVDRLQQFLGEKSSELAGLDLARQALMVLLAGDCPGTILAGMRKIDYVRNLFSVYSLKKLDRSLHQNLTKWNLKEFIKKELSS